MSSERLPRTSALITATTAIMMALTVYTQKPPWSTGAQLTAAMQQVIDRVHARGLVIVGGRLFPLARPDRARWPSQMDAQRLAVNDWIRTTAGFDRVIDFHRLMSGGPCMTAVSH